MLREFLTSRNLRHEHWQGGTEAARFFEPTRSILAKRNGAVSSAAQFTKPEGGNAFVSANLAGYDSKCKCHWTKRGPISIPKRLVAGFACHQNATLGIYITRDILANIETLRSIATDKQIVVFAEVFGVPVDDLFPPKQQSSGRIVGLNR